MKTSASDAALAPPAPRAGFSWSRAPWGFVLRADALAHVPHGWTAKPLRLRPPEPDEWAQVAGVAGVEPKALVHLRQVHGAAVHVVDGPAAAGMRPEADIAVTASGTFAVAVQVADCVPLLVAGRRAVAAAHAGWRGTAANVAGTAIEALVRLGEDRRDLHAAIGPSIGPCCYEVGDELADRFAEAGWRDVLDRWFTRPGSERHLDLWTANRDQLIAAGVPAAQVHASGLCTRCHGAWFHSYRREGAAAGRMAGFIRGGGAG
ncbi:MAG TPA: polyphenol oxidase family protein [Vicinamibacterales bacterium]